MTRLDQNRAVTQLAKRAGVPVTEVANVAIWGNHSATQFPDFENATISGKPAASVIGDEAWLQGQFLTTVQKRGAAIIEARGASSAASAANAAIDTVVSLTTPTPDGTAASVAVSSTGEYGVPEGLTFGFPVVADGMGAWSVKPGFEHTEFAQEKIRLTTEELLEERAEVRLLGLISA
jgi:malate dehydrogenase